VKWHCAALAGRSFVVGADGLSYRCGLQVGEKHRSVGQVTASNLPFTVANNFADKSWWDSFDPTVQPNCSRCFIPADLLGWVAGIKYSTFAA
jgi:uncharacterized protein